MEAAQIWQELVPHYFPADCFGFGCSSDLAGTTTKKPTQSHNCTGSDLAGTGSTFFSGGLFWRQLRYGGKNNNNKMTTVLYTKYMLIKTDTTAQLEKRFLQPTRSKCIYQNPGNLIVDQSMTKERPMTARKGIKIQRRYSTTASTPH